MDGYSYMNTHLIFRLFKFINKSILHSRIRSIIYLVDDINYFMIVDKVLNRYYFYLPNLIYVHVYPHVN